MELRQQLRDGDPASRSDAWLGRVRVGQLAGGPRRSARRPGGRLTAASPKADGPRRPSPPKQQE